jgi:general secretion pathway protein D
VLIPDDEILVLGGLIRDELSDGEDRVPVLGRIPILGNLFKSKSTTLTKTNLMIFIHPRILHEAGSYGRISAEKYNHLRDRQIHFDSKVEHFWIPGESPVLPELETLSDGGGENTQQQAD